MNYNDYKSPPDSSSILKYGEVTYWIQGKAGSFHIEIDEERKLLVAPEVSPEQEQEAYTIMRAINQKINFDDILSSKDS